MYRTLSQIRSGRRADDCRADAVHFPATKLWPATLEIHTPTSAGVANRGCLIPADLTNDHIEER